MELTRYTVIEAILFLVWFAALASLTGCTEFGQEEELTCAWLNDSSNCWQQALTQAQSCAASGSGTFDASNRVCTYSDSTTVNFSSAVTFNSSDQWDFSVGTSGQCMAFREISSGRNFQLSTNNGDVIVDEQGLSLSITCPDGSSYSTSDTSMLFDTCDQGFEFLPDYSVSLGSNQAALSLSGGRSGSVTAFDCRK